MPQGTADSPELFNPWIGKTYGNILDQYDSSTYNAKLYLINQNSAPATSPDESADAARDNTGPAGNSRSTLTAKPNETVVIAQSGVTAGNIIDDITINIFKGIVTFTVKQPNRADLLDQITLARSFLGSEQTQAMDFYLEINFLGYTAEDDFMQAGGSSPEGRLVNIIGPYRYKLNLRTLEMSLDSTGSTYNFETTFKENEAYTDRRFRLNQNITARGKTITEMVQSVEDGLNKFMQNNNDKQVKDEVAFDLSGLLQSASNTSDPNKVLIEDENLILPNADTGDDTKAPLNKADASSEKTAEQRIADSTNPDADPDAIENEESTNIINFNIGENIESLMNKILAMNPEAIERHTRKQNTTDIDDLSCNKGQAFVQKLKINAGVEDLGFDKRTRQSSFKITYRPVLYRTATDVQFAIPEENEDLTPADIKTRLEQTYDSGNLRKGYQYLFTGNNDQILNLDINFDKAQSALMTPRRGLVGTTDAATGLEKTDTVDEDTDTSSSGLLDSLSKGFEALAKDTISNLLSGDFSGLQGGLESFASTLASEGFSQIQLDQLSQAIETQSQAELNQFLESVDSATLRNLATNLLINPGNVTDTNPPDYSPEQSGYQYSEDFYAVDSTNGIDVGDLEQLGFVSDIASPDSKPQIDNVAVETDVPSVNPVEGVTVDHKRPQANSIFGQLINQGISEAFLKKIEMTIRGDPWYLGYDTSQGQSNNSQAAQSSSQSQESSQPEYASFATDQNYFFLEIASPRPWDFDYRDEDSLLNTGYWMNTNTSHAFSGLYQITGVVHSFNKGMYTVDVAGSKIETITTNKLEKKQPPS